MSKTTFAIGDIHGMANHLQSMLSGVFDYIKKENVEDWKLIFLGDYIDRGPDSAKVIDTILTLKWNHPDRIVTLRGNHEWLLLKAVEAKYSSDTENFLNNGGHATLLSFGVTQAANIPTDYLDFFENTLISYEDDLRYFVHAGVNPDYTLADQTEFDRLWIRREFLEHPSKFEKYIVHGHTPRMYDLQGGNIYGNRLNLDGGAVFGGKLMCAVFNDNQEKPVDYILVGEKDE